MSIVADKKDGKTNGRWRVQLKRGAEYYRKRFDTYAEAQAAEGAVKAAWERGETLQEAAPRAVAASAPDSLEVVYRASQGHLWAGQDTEKESREMLRRTVDLLGPLRTLDSLTTRDIDNLAADCKRHGRADGTVNRYLSNLRVFLDWACDRQYMGKAAFADIKWAWKAEKKGRIRVLTDIEEATLRDCLPLTEWYVVKIGIETGCRRDEILTAEARDIRNGRLYIWENKTDEPRSVPILAETLEMFRYLLEAPGRMPTRKSLRYRWNNARAKMGLSEDAEFVFHCTRHTRATRLVRAGVPLQVIQKLLGHKDIKTTERYAHVEDDLVEQVVNQVGYGEVLDYEKARENGMIPGGLPGAHWGANRSNLLGWTKRVAEQNAAKSMARPTR